MTDNKPDAAPEDEPDATAAETETDSEAAEDISEEGALSNRLLNMEAELTDTKDRLMRAVAETENVRRRAEREKQDASQYAVTKFARDILSVADNMRRALEAIPEESRADDSPLKGLVGGLDMTERELLTVFERHGIQKLDPTGEKFDHNFHQAMSEVETDSTAPGHVVQVYQSGYVLNDRLLRPAMVVVAKAKQAAEPPADAAAGVDKTV
ncbi:MAG: nucleotide exchange factor GrpE [Pseudomonadota bacterium]|mgnify:CR=1 FL=1